MPVRPFYSYSGGVARAGTKGGLWRPNGTPEPNQGHEGSVLKLDGPAALLKRCVASVCWPQASVSACGVLLAFQFAGSFSCRVELSNVAVQSSIPASSTGFDPHVLLELWPLAGLVGCAGWPRRCDSLVVCGVSGS